MFKKLGKLLAVLAAIGAVCAGIYYFINKKNSSDEEDEFMDDFEDDFELDDDLGEVSSREYVPLHTGSKDTSEASDDTDSFDEDDDDMED